MVHAIRFHEAGGPEVMKWEEVEVGDPGPGEIRVKQTAAGLNFIDIYLSPLRRTSRSHAQWAWPRRRW